MPILKFPPSDDKEYCISHRCEKVCSDPAMKHNPSSIEKSSHVRKQYLPLCTHLEERHPLNIPESKIFHSFQIQIIPPPPYIEDKNSCPHLNEDEICTPTKSIFSFFLSRKRNYCPGSTRNVCLSRNHMSPPQLKSIPSTEKCFAALPKKHCVWQKDTVWQPKSVPSSTFQVVSHVFSRGKQGWLPMTQAGRARGFGAETDTWPRGEGGTRNLGRIVTGKFDHHCIFTIRYYMLQIQLIIHHYAFYFIWLIVNYFLILMLCIVNASLAMM